MRKNKFRLGVLLAGIMFFMWVSASAQQIQNHSQRPTGSAEGSLAVTATVVSSTGVIIGPDGQQRLIVANAAAGPADNGSHLQTVKDVQRAPVADGKPVSAPLKPKQQKP